MEERRRYKRITVEGVNGNILFASKAEIINISLGGAAIQIDVNLKLGKEYTLRLQGKTKHLEIKGTTIWSLLCGSQKGLHGDVVPIYHAGLQFIHVLTNQASELIKFIESHKIKGTEERLRGLRFKILTTGKAVLDYSFGYRVKLISLGGMLIETMQAFKPEDRFPMEVILKDGAVIKFLGRVASCMEIAGKHPIHYDIGVEFLEMSSADRAKIEEFIRSIS